MLRAPTRATSDEHRYIRRLHPEPTTRTQAKVDSSRLQTRTVGAAGRCMCHQRGVCHWQTLLTTPSAGEQSTEEQQPGTHTVASRALMRTFVQNMDYMLPTHSGSRIRHLKAPFRDNAHQPWL